jgi:TldD protein
MTHPIPPAMFAPSQLPSADGAPADPLDHARGVILAPAALDENRVAGILGEVMGHAVDYSDVYFQAVREESWSLEDGIVKDGAHSIDRGVGVRALAGERTGFAYSDEVVLPALLESARAARAIARSGSTGALQAWHARGGRELYTAVDPIDTLDDRDKVSLLEEIDREGACTRSAYHPGDGEPVRVARDHHGTRERRHPRG